VDFVDDPGSAAALSAADASRTNLADTNLRLAADIPHGAADRR
jgi:hypothetical protein